MSRPISTIFGREIRFTDAVYDRHLLDDGRVLWLGRSDLMVNVLTMAARDKDGRVLCELAVKMRLSYEKRRSIGWS